MKEQTKKAILDLIDWKRRDKYKKVSECPFEDLRIMSGDIVFAEIFHEGHNPDFPIISFRNGESRDFARSQKGKADFKHVIVNREALMKCLKIMECELVIISVEDDFPMWIEGTTDGGVQTVASCVAPIINWEDDE